VTRVRYYWIVELSIDTIVAMKKVPKKEKKKEKKNTTLTQIIHNVQDNSINK